MHERTNNQRLSKLNETDVKPNVKSEPSPSRFVISLAVEKIEAAVETNKHEQW